MFTPQNCLSKLLIATTICTSLTTVSVRGDTPQPSSAQAEQKVGKSQSGKTFQGLYELAIKYDCYFTSERMGLSGEPMLHSPFELETVPADLASLVSVLNKKFEQFNFFLDEKGTPVIHILGRQIPNEKGYKLGEKITLSYRGNLFDLPEKLHELGKPIESQRVFVPPDMFTDRLTHVEFSVNQWPIRSILSNHVPFSDYGRFIFLSAFVSGIRDEKVCTVRFSGPMLKSPDVKGDWAFVYPWAKPDPANEGLFPFTEGEVTYFRNDNTEATQNAAMKYVREKAGSKDTLQVRWAMLFLGKNKVERSIPLLLQFLDYQWAPVPIAEERYPAVKALSAIGKPASAAALMALKTEKNPLRLELLSRVVIRVEGADEATRAIKAMANETADKAQEKAILSALGAATDPNKASAFISYRPHSRT